VKKKQTILFLLIHFIFDLHAATSIEPPHSGNFSLPISQQPGPLVSFGQNIVKRNQAQVFLYPSYLKAPQQQYPNASPSLLYGFSDNASLFITTPIAINYTNNKQRASGFADTSVQGEYAFYNKDNDRFSDQSTVVGGMTLPSGSFIKRPQTGQGTVGYFIGTTFNRTSIDWMFFASPGITLFKPTPTTPFESQYLYQVGIGRNIKSIPDKSILLVMVELDGLYSKNNLQLNALYSNAGGNIVLATPSLWFSTQHLILQAGLSLPISQHVAQPQDKISYYAIMSIGWLL